MSERACLCERENVFMLKNPVFPHFTIISSEVACFCTNPIATILLKLFLFFFFHFQNFREQCIDGCGLSLLTEDHLMHSLNMKLGPALKLRSKILKLLGGPCPCVSCNSLAGNANNCTATVSTVPSPLNRPSSTGSGT